jgi:hypothetical protein
MMMMMMMMMPRCTVRPQDPHTVTRHQVTNNARSQMHRPRAPHVLHDGFKYSEEIQIFENSNRKFEKCA